MMLEETGILIKIRLIAPVPPPVCPDKSGRSGGDNWANGTKASPGKMVRAASRRIREFEDFIRQKALREGITEEDVLKNSELAKMLKGLRLSRRKLIRTLTRNETGVSRFDAGVDKGKGPYESARWTYRYPLHGSKKEKVKGLIFLGLMALTGDGQLVKYLKPGIDKMSAGQPLVICPAERQKDFGKALRAQMAESGAIIIKDKFSREIIKNQTRKLNRLVNSFRLAELAEFEPGGASHIDFIVVDVPDPDQPAAFGEPRPCGRGAMKEWLGLDIQVMESKK